MQHLHYFVALSAACIIATSAAFAWGDGVHVYIADHLGARHALQNTYELYGTLIPDLYSTRFDTEGLVLDNIFQTADRTVWDAASKPALKSTAYGILTHSEVYGADLDAHAPGTGYIFLKGVEVSPILAPTIIAVLKNGGIDDATAAYVAENVGPLLGHGLAEYAVDMLISRRDDRLVGAKTIAAALARPGETPALLGQVYGPRVALVTQLSLPDAQAKITADEKAYRKEIIRYGTILCMDENAQMRQFAVISAAIGEVVLESIVQVDLTVTTDQAEAMLRAVVPYVAKDYKAAVNASIDATEARLRAAGITNADAKFVFWKDGAEAAGSASIPTAFALSGNYPNPFNPSTTLRYSVPAASAVRVSVCDLLGREVAVLVDEVKDPGEYAVHWNAGGHASGIYFCRMTAGSFVETVRMTLQK